MPKALVTATTYPHYEVPKGYTVQIDDNGDVVFRDARGNEHKPDPQIKDRQKQPPPFQDGIWQIVNTGLPSGASHMSRFQYNVIVPVMPAANASTIHYCWGGLSHWDSALNYDSLAHPVMRCIYPGYGDASWMAWPSFFSHTYGLLGTAPTAMGSGQNWSGYAYCSGQYTVVGWMAPAGGTDPDPLVFDNPHWKTGMANGAVLGSYEPFNITDRSQLAPWFEYYNVQAASNLGHIPDGSWNVHYGWPNPISPFCGGGTDLIANLGNGGDAVFKTYVDLIL